MNDMRDILDLINEMSEEQGSVELQDSFNIELGEDLLIESGVVDINEEGILIEGDDKTLELLSEHGLVLEETDWKKYDEPTVNRIKSGKTKPVDKTDYDKPTYQRKKEKEEKKDIEEAVDLDEAEYQGRNVPLGKPMAGDVKKSKVYVRKPNGKVVKVNFGDKKMRIKKSNPGRRKNFRARHNCDNPGPRWKARYWSCRAW